MKQLSLLLAAAACQSAPAPAGKAAGCDVTVRFGSYAMGIDTAAAAAIEKAVAGSRDVKGVQRLGQGREGEYALCVTTGNKAAAERLFRRISALLPERPRGPISVQGPAGRREAPAR